jgi:Fic family protein
MRYIHEHKNWPNFTWKVEEVINLLSEVRNLQGRVMGRMLALGFDLRNEANLETLTLEVLKSTEIEGEFLNSDQVRSSIARKLGMDIPNSVLSDRNVDGVVEMMIDAIQFYDQPLTAERLFGWHSALFPGGRSGMYKIRVGNWRIDSTGPMQVVSGAMGREKVHFQAPDSLLLEKEMSNFLDWFNTNNEMDLVLKAAVAHLWFVTIHPFDDGNGRITRAITDMLLLQSDRSTQRFYSMSAQVLILRKQYYEKLEKTQKDDLDITNWICWFLNCLIKTLQSTDTTLNTVLFKADFWNRHFTTEMSARQRKLVNKLLDGFDGKLTSSKWAKIAKCSKDTAIRDINDLIQKSVLEKEAAGGRSTSYELSGR